MAPESTGVEQAVSRTLRENLNKLQRTADELHEAVADLVAACASTRPSNALPPMIRAQTAAASLAAALDVLSRFVTAALQPGHRTAAEEEVLRRTGVARGEPGTAETLRPGPAPLGQTHEVAFEEASDDMVSEGAPVISTEVAIEPAPMASEATLESSGDPAFSYAEYSEEMALPLLSAGQAAAFDLTSLPVEDQELHRRANRVAKVSMQDIKMLRPDQVRLGREHKDICLRLRDDIEKARKEYDRRFRPIMGQPVDYFYHWMVEILAEGNPDELGEYPYPSPVLRG